MAPVRFSTLKGVPGTYDVRRDATLLGCVFEVECVESTRWPAKARIRKVRRWQFQMIGADVCRSKYTTRRAAASGLVSWFDAHDRPEGSR